MESTGSGFLRIPADYAGDGCPRCRLLVFSDLDDTLLDKQTYSWAPATGAIPALAERGIPLILSSSRTLSEISEVASSLGNVAPFIFENGAGVALPPGLFPALDGLVERQGWRVKLFGGDRAKVLEALHLRRGTASALIFGVRASIATSRSSRSTTSAVSRKRSRWKRLISLVRTNGSTSSAAAESKTAPGRSPWHPISVPG